MKIIAGVATLGRPEAVGQAVTDLARQTRKPDRVIVSATRMQDTAPAAFAASPLTIETLFGPPGATRQRNAILDVAGDADVILFLDDDFVMAPDYLSRLEQIFARDPGLAVVTGDVLADGIGSAGISHRDAVAIIDKAPPGTDDMVPVNNGYGCNMAFRVGPIRDHHPRFDESLPLYGWLEDVDFSRRVAAHGDCVKAMALRGVHLGTKGGRTSGKRLGYSQIVNPVYLVGRRTLKPLHAGRLMARNVAANAAMSLRPEPWIDRRGRLLGNILACCDLLLLRIDPLRVLRIVGRHDRRS